jgi:tRNA1(Val) A37 N6-methylase TrmN6
MTDFEKTKDDFLGGRVNLSQPKKGYRITSDSIFLAACLSPKNNDRILDVGAGTGAILSCLYARIPIEATLHGIELQDQLIELARINGIEKIQYFQGDMFSEVEGCEPNSYHQVVSNPPYYDKGTVTNSPFETKATAFGKEMDDLKLWIERLVRMARPKGYVTVVHRADRIDDIISVLAEKCGSIVIYPFYSKQGKDASRVIIRAQKDAKGLLSLKSGMIVHTSDGNYSAAAENILRNAQHLDITK